MRKRFALAALLLAIAPPDTGAGAPANRVEAIQHAATGAQTTIRVRGSRTPTFTVYKLERPARVVVDLAPAEMSSDLRGAGDGGAAGEDGATFGVNSWSVQRVSAHESGEGSRRGVRVVIALARPATYNVETEGRDLVVRVTAREPAMRDERALGAEAKARAASEQARMASDDARSARAEAARARDDARRAREDAQKSQADARRVMEEAAAIKKRAQETAARAQKDVADARAEAERARGEDGRAHV